MLDYVVGRCINCCESHVFTSPASRDAWLTTHFLPEPLDRYTTDTIAGALG
jgi:hypothetical protein